MGKDIVTLASLRKYTPEELRERLVGFRKQQPTDIIHKFGPGLYIREMYMKKGTFAVGEDHKIPSENIMLKGHVRMVNPDGTYVDVIAPVQFSGIGGRKVGYFMQDTVWLNIFATQIRDAEVLEEMIAGPNGALLLDGKKKLLAIPYDDSVESSFKRNKDFDEDLPNGAYLFRKASNGSSSGLFASSKIKDGTVLGIFKSGRYSWIARHIRHSSTPNCVVINNMLVACSDIQGNHGGNIGEELTIDMRK